VTVWGRRNCKKTHAPDEIGMKLDGIVCGAMVMHVGAWQLIWGRDSGGDLYGAEIAMRSRSRRCGDLIDVVRGAVTSHHYFFVILVWMRWMM
jgi:hypothetical protein